MLRSSTLFTNLNLPLPETQVGWPLYRYSEDREFGTIPRIRYGSFLINIFCPSILTADVRLDPEQAILFCHGHFKS